MPSKTLGFSSTEAPLAADLQDSDTDVLSQINVTPFVDVMLVLLVVFIATAPILLKETVAIRLPKARTTDGASVKTQTLGVAVSAQGDILLDGRVVSEEELARNIRERMSVTPDLQAIIAADENSRHADLVRVLGWIKSAGLEKFALQVKREN